MHACRLLLGHTHDFEAVLVADAVRVLATDERSLIAVVEILSSVSVAVQCANDRYYRWLGTQNLPGTLAQLEAHGRAHRDALVARSISVVTLTPRDAARDFICMLLSSPERPVRVLKPANRPSRHMRRVMLEVMDVLTALGLIVRVRVWGDGWSYAWAADLRPVHYRTLHRTRYPVTALSMASPPLSPSMCAPLSPRLSGVSVPAAVDLRLWTGELSEAMPMTLVPSAMPWVPTRRQEEDRARKHVIHFFITVGWVAPGFVWRLAFCTEAQARDTLSLLASHAVPHEATDLVFERRAPDMLQLVSTRVRRLSPDLWLASPPLPPELLPAVVPPLLTLGHAMHQ